MKNLCMNLAKLSQHSSEQDRSEKLNDMSLKSDQSFTTVKNGSEKHLAPPPLSFWTRRE